MYKDDFIDLSHMGNNLDLNIQYQRFVLMLCKFFNLNDVLMLCCHRSLIRCVIANGLISEVGDTVCERGKGNVVIQLL